VIYFAAGGQKKSALILIGWKEGVSVIWGNKQAERSGDKLGRRQHVATSCCRVPKIEKEEVGDAKG